MGASGMGEVSKTPETNPRAFVLKLAIAVIGSAGLATVSLWGLSIPLGVVIGIAVLVGLAIFLVGGRVQRHRKLRREARLTQFKGVLRDLRRGTSPLLAPSELERTIKTLHPFERGH